MLLLKKNIKVVSQMKIKFASNADNTSITSKPGYKKGFLTTYKDHTGSYKLKYGRKNCVKSVIQTGDDGKVVYKHVWKKGKLSKVDLSSSLEHVVFGFKYKGKKVNRIIENGVAEGDGEKEKWHLVYKYKYKKNKISKQSYKNSSGKVTDSFKYDKKGNMISCISKLNGNKVAYTKVKFNYKKGYVSTMSVEEKEPWIESPLKYKVSYKYKSVKVKKSAVKRIKAQQWKLINQNNAISFAWFVQ
jgi:hypothetical protein